MSTGKPGVSVIPAMVGSIYPGLGYFPLSIGEDGTLLIRVSGSEGKYYTESYDTTDVSQTARPINGDFDLERKLQISVFIRNIGENTANINILGSLDGGNTFVLIERPDLILSSGEAMLIKESTPLTILRIIANSKVSGLHTTLQTQGYSIGW